MGKQNDGSLKFDTRIDKEGFEKDVKSLEKMSTTAFTAIGAAAVAGFGAAIKVGGDFEEAMSSVAAISMATSEEYEMLSSAAREMGETTKFSATESANALEYLSLAGYNAKESVQALPYVLDLAAAGGMDLAYASDLLTDSMAVMGLGISDMGNFSDQLAMAASKANTSVQQLGEAVLVAGGQAKLAGMSTDQMNTALSILADKGIKGSEGGTALRNVLKNLYTPTSAAAKVMKSLGIETSDANGNLIKAQDVLKQLKSKLDSLSASKRIEAMGDIFDTRTIAAANALLDDCGDRWNELTGYLNDCGGAARDMAKTMNDNLKGDMTILKSAAEGLGIAFYNAFNRKMRSGVQSATEAIGDMTELMNNPATIQNIKFLATSFGVGASAVGAYKAAVLLATAAQAALNTTIQLNPLGIAAAGMAALTVGTIAVANAVKEADENYYKIGETLTGVSSKFYETVDNSKITQEHIEGWRELKARLDDGGLSASQVADAESKIKEHESWFIENYGQFISVEEAKNGVRAETIDKLAEENELLSKNAALELESSLLDISSQIPELTEKVEALKKTNEALNEEESACLSNSNALKALSNEWEVYKRINRDTWDDNDAAAKMQEIADKARELTGVEIDVNKFGVDLQYYLDTFSNQADGLGKIISDNEQKIKDGQATIENYTKNVQKLIDFDTDATLEEKTKKAEEFGMQFCEGIVKGIDVESPAVLASIDALCEKMVAKANKKLDINSPSKVMRDEVGVAVAEGIAKGILKGLPIADDAAEKAAKDIIDSAKDELDIHSPSGVADREIGQMLSLGVAKGIETSSDTAVKAFQSMLEKLQYQRDFDIINEYEYYTELEKLRDKYFKAGTSEWLRYTKEIYKYQKSSTEAQKREIENLYKDISDYASKKIDEVLAKQDKFASKLKSYTHLYNTNTLSMDDKEFSFYSMHDLKKDTEAITSYVEGLNSLNERLQTLGVSNDIVKEFMAEMSNMDIEEGAGFTKTLLNSNDTDLLKYINAYSDNRNAIKGLSSRYYQDDMDAAWDDSIQNMINKLQEAGYEIPEGFFTSGTVSAEKFGEAFTAEIDNQLATVRQKVEGFYAAITRMFGAGFEISAVGGGGNTYSSTYYIQPNDTSTSAQLSAIRAEEKLNKLRGGY